MGRFIQWRNEKNRLELLSGDLFHSPSVGPKFSETEIFKD
jgi:hypothetical protein